MQDQVGENGVADVGVEKRMLWRAAAKDIVVPPRSRMQPRLCQVSFAKAFAKSFAKSHQATSSRP